MCTYNEWLIIMFTFTEFSTLEEMKTNLSEGAIGRVLLDRNTASHFLYKYHLKRKRQIRLIRNIDFPLDYYLVHVNRKTIGDNVTQISATCGRDLEQISSDLIGIGMQTVTEQVVAAELQVIR